MDSVLDSTWKHCRQAEQLYSFKIPYCDGIGSSHKHDPWLSVFRAHPAFLSNPELSFPFYPLSLSPNKKNLVTSIVFLRSKVFREPLNITGPNQRITWSGLHPRLHLSTSTHPYIHPPILASVRYAAWSGDARARVGPCGSPCFKAPWMNWLWRTWPRTREPWHVTRCPAIGT